MNLKIYRAIANFYNNITTRVNNRLAKFIERYVLSVFKVCFQFRETKFLKQLKKNTKFSHNCHICTENYNKYSWKKYLVEKILFVIDLLLQKHIVIE